MNPKPKPPFRGCFRCLCATCAKKDGCKLIEALGNRHSHCLWCKATNGPDPVVTCKEYVSEGVKPTV